MAKILENKFLLLLINILMPYVLAVLLSDLAGINISTFMKSIFSILQSIELVGYLIQTKSMILFFVFLFFPLSLIIFKKFITTDAYELADKDITSYRLIWSNLIVLICTCAPIYLYISGVNIAELVEDGYVQPGMRIFLSSVTSDFKFSLFSSFTVFLICFAYISLVLSIKAIFIRLKDQLY